MEYRPHFTTYAKFDRPRYEVFKILTEKYVRPRPLSMDIFEVTNSNGYCDFHKKYGHVIEDCCQLKDVLEKMTRFGELTQYLKKDFYEQNVHRYNETEKVFKKILPLRKDWEENKKRNRGPVRKEPKNRQSPEPHGTSVIHVISGGIASGGDTNKERRMYSRGRASEVVLSVEEVMGNKRVHEDEVIYFSEKDMEGVKRPHDDVIVLSLKINIHRVERILVDTRSSADVLYLPALKVMGYDLMDLQTI